MRLIRKKLNPDGTTEVTLSVASSEDLWHLYNFIIRGDSVRTRTKRKVVKEREIGNIGAEMKMLMLQVDVKDVAFNPDEVRVQGVNTTESSFVKLGAHHTLTIHSYPPQEVTVVKREWDDIADERLKEACQQESRADTVAILMNFGEAQLLVVANSFIHVKAKLDVTIAKKHKNDGTSRDRSIQRFFKQVLDAILTHVDFEKVKLVLICSPGHVREEFYEYMRNATLHQEQGPLKIVATNLNKFLLVKVHSNTIGGLKEAFNDGAVSARMETTRCSSDLRTWDEFQTLISRDPDRCVYTAQCVFYAAQYGAIGTIMVSDAVFRSPDPIVRRFFLSLLHFVKQGGSKVSIFSSHHVTGEQLAQLGDIAAILMFPCPQLDDMEVVEDFVHSPEVETFIRENAAAKLTAT